MWEISWTAGKASVRKSSTADSTAVKMTPQTLAQLYIGFRSVLELTSSGELMGDAAQLELLTRAFPRTPAYLDDWF